MRRNKGFFAVLTAILVVAFSFSASPASAQQPTTHKAKFEGSITLDPGITNAAAPATGSDKFELVKLNGKWVYRRASVNSNNFSLSAEAATALVKDLAAGQAARKQAANLKKEVKEAGEKIAAVQESVDDVGKAQQGQASEIAKLKGSIDDPKKGLQAQINAVKKTADDAASSASYGTWGLGVSIVALLLAGFAVFRSYRVGDGMDKWGAESLTGRERRPAATAAVSGAGAGDRGAPAPADAG